MKEDSYLKPQKNFFFKSSQMLLKYKRNKIKISFSDLPFKF